MPGAPAPSPAGAMPSNLGSDVLLSSMDVASIAMGIVSLDESVFLTLNQSMADLLELSIAQTLGRKLTDFRPGPAGRFRSQLERSGGRPAQFRNIEVTTALGNTLHVDATLAHYGNYDGVPALLVVLADASVRVAAQNQARRLIRAADRVSDLVSIHDLQNGTLLYCNDAFTAATGVRPGDRDNPVEGMSPSQLDILDAEVIPAIERDGSWTGTLEMDLGDGVHWLAGTIVGESC
ncbi:MAG: PAS domain-containing protein [Acidimicrobiales bacterium]